MIRSIERTCGHAEFFKIDVANLEKTQTLTLENAINLITI